MQVDLLSSQSDTIHVFNEFKRVMSAMFHESHFIFFILGVLGIQYCSVFVSIFIESVQRDMFHTDDFNIQIKEDIFFYMYFICFFIVPPLLHKYGPKFMMIIMLIATIICLCLEQIVLFGNEMSYVAIVCSGFVNATMNVTIRRFIYENCTHETISMHYGITEIIIKLMNCISVLLSLIYDIDENDYYYMRYFTVITIFFIITVIRTIATLFTNDHHKEYCNGMRSPYLKYDIVEEKDN